MDKDKRLNGLLRQKRQHLAVSLGYCQIGLIIYYSYA